MRATILALLIVSIQSFGQTSDWYSFHTKKDEHGYVDKNGTIKIPPGKYSICYTDTFKTFAVVTYPGKGFVAIDKAEKVLFEVFPFDNGPDPVQDGLFRVIEANFIGFANEAGQIVIRPTFTAVTPFSNGLAAYCDGCRKRSDGEHWSWADGKWGFINKLGVKVIRPEYDQVLIPFQKGKAKVLLNGNEFWIDATGKKI